MHAPIDTFPGMAHVRGVLRICGLATSPPLGPTWHARGLASPIDCWLFRAEAQQSHCWKSPDMREALPSDHDPIFLRLHDSRAYFHRTWRPQDRTGHWTYNESKLQALLHDAQLEFTQENLETACAACATRPLNLRYRDSDFVKTLIRQRRNSTNIRERASLMEQVRQQRGQDKLDHKLQLWERAKGGDRQAISFLRRSAAGASYEGGYIAARGGADAAAEELQEFYRRKYARQEPAPPPASKVAALSVTPDVRLPDPITQEDLVACIQGMKRRTSCGLDGVSYEALLSIVVADPHQRLPRYLTDILHGTRPLPRTWSQGKVTLMPKIKSPQGPKDLRPICLTPCLGKIFGKLLMRRVSSKAPPYRAGQMGCRAGSQALDGVAAAHIVLQQLRARGRAGPCVAKLDIQAAFDSISHHAVLNWLLLGEASREKELLWQLISTSGVQMGIGHRRWKHELGRGLLQGTTFSADIFSRVLDWYMGGLLVQWGRKYEDWTTRVGRLCHLLLYADDLLIFADTPQDLQAKVQDVVDCLSAIGLQPNLSKSKVLAAPGGGAAPAVWLRGQVTPLPAEEHMLYLGVPMSLVPNAEVMLSHVLRKTSHTYHAFRSLLRSPHTPTREASSV